MHAQRLTYLTLPDGGCDFMGSLPIAVKAAQERKSKTDDQLCTHQLCKIFPHFVSNEKTR